MARACAVSLMSAMRREGSGHYLTGVSYQQMGWVELGRADLFRVGGVYLDLPTSLPLGSPRCSRHTLLNGHRLGRFRRRALYIYTQSWCNCKWLWSNGLHRKTGPDPRVLVINAQAGGDFSFIFLLVEKVTFFFF